MSSFSELSERSKSVIDLHTKSSVHIDSIKKEIEELVSGIGPIPISSSVSDLSVLIGKVQGAKDRISEITNEAQSEYIFVDKICDMIFEAAVHASSQTSADKRKGEAAIISSQFVFIKAQSESFYKYCLGTMKNLDSKHEAISRMITCMQMLMNNFNGGTRMSDSSVSSGIRKSGSMDRLFDKNGNISSEEENSSTKILPF